MEEAGSQFFDGKAEVLDLAHEVIMVRDMEDRVLFWNRGAEKIYGWNREEALGKCAHELLKTLWPEPIDSIMSDLTTNDRWEGEQVDTRKDGTKLVLNTYWTLKRDDRGMPDFIFEISTDVTQQKHAEEALEESERNYRELVECSNSIILKMKRDGTVTFFNRFAERFLGFSQHEIIGRSVIGTIVPKTESSGRDLEEMIRDLCSNPEKYRHNENENVRKNGERLWIAWTNKGVRDKDGNVTQVLCVGNDITEYRKAVEGQLRLASAAEAALEGILLISTTGLIDFVNSAFTNMTGLTREELIGKHIDALNYGDEFLSSQALQELHKAPDGISKRVHLKRRGGATYVTDMTLAPVKDQQGRTMNYVGVFCDVTEQVFLERQVRYRQKMEATGRLAGGIAHNLNNILAMILGFAELAEEDVRPDSPAAASLAQIIQAAHRATKFVRDILTFTRESPEGVEPVPAGQVVGEAVAALGAATPRSIEITTEIKDRRATVRANPWDLKQIVVNTGSNALQAMQQSGGKLLVSLDRVTVETELRLPFTTLPPGPYVKLVFADTGPGITDAAMEHIFDPFFTGRDPAEAKGIGLAVVNGIVRSLKGGIFVESKPHKGTTFMIYLPIAETGEEEPELRRT